MFHRQVNGEQTGVIHSNLNSITHMPLTDTT